MTVGTAAAVVLTGAVASTGAAASAATRQTGSPAAAAGRPRFTVSMPPTGVFELDIRNAVTGRRTGEIKIPNRPGSTWNSLSAESEGSFVATDVAPGDPSLIYRLRPNARGTSASRQPIAVIRNTNIMASAINPAGTRFFYFNLLIPRHRPISQFLRLQNPRTGRILGTWPVPLSWNVSGIAINASGSLMAVSAYNYLVHGNTNTALIQHTYLLRPASSGTPLPRLPALSDQAWPLALSRTGRTLYEVRQVTGVSATSFQSRKVQAFQLDAVSTSTRRVTAVLHTWHATFQQFAPALALDPGGRYLLVVNRTTMAVENLATRRFATLPGRLSPALKTESHPGGPLANSGPDQAPIAW